MMKSNEDVRKSEVSYSSGKSPSKREMVQLITRMESILGLLQRKGTGNFDSDGFLRDRA